MSSNTQQKPIMSGGLTLTIINDPGHGWLIVPQALAAKLNLTTQDFTSCSFMNGGNFYLEEDADAATFLAAHHKAFGALPAIKDEYMNDPAPCREYPRCAGTAPKWEAATAYLAEVLK